MLTRILRLLHVAQPLDFPGMPTMMMTSKDHVVGVALGKIYRID